MIDPAAVEAYLARPMRDMHALKHVDDYDLGKEIVERVGKPGYVLNPRHHQRVAIVLGLRFKRLVNLFRQGLGKTACPLQTHRLLKRVGKAKGDILVLVPGIANVVGWVEQVQTHTPDLTCNGIIGTKEERLEILEKPADLLVMTYAAAMRYCSKKKRKPRKGSHARLGKKPGMKMVPDPKKYKAIAKRFGMVVFDECACLSNQLGLPHKIARRLSMNIERCHGLTGTPFGSDPMDLFGIFLAVDQGETFGTTIAMYREAFFTEKKGYWGGATYTPKKSMKKILHRMMRNRSIRFGRNECDDLPKVIRDVRPVVLPQSTWQHYEKVRAQARAAAKNHQMLTSSYINARYLTAGFMMVKGPNGEKIRVDFKDNPKLEILKQLIDGTDADDKIIVFVYYQATGDMLEKAMKEWKIGHTRLTGGKGGKEKVQAKFRDDPNCRVLICSTAGAYGLNLQFSSTSVFYETPSDPKEREQMEARQDRTGQKKTVLMYDLPVKGSVDEKILKSIKAGVDLFNLIVDGKEIV